MAYKKRDKRNQKVVFSDKELLAAVAARCKITNCS